MTDFPKKYNPKEFESDIYSFWEENNCFQPQESDSRKSFYIPMPPPNVTSKLHIGHAMMLAVEDIMARYHRMK